MKKTPLQQNSFVVVASTIQKDPKNLHFRFNDKECQALAQRFELPKVKSFEADLTLYRDEVIHVKGTFISEVIYTSVVSLEEFNSTINEKIDVLLSEEPPAESDEIIDQIERGRIDLKEILFEQFGLALMPFPKKESEQGEFVYQEESDTENPFQKLKEIMKK